MLMSRKELENKCKELEARISKLEKATNDIKDLYEKCNIRIFVIKYGFSRLDIRHAYVKIDMLNKKLYMFSYYELDSLLDNIENYRITDCKLLENEVLITRLSIIRRKDNKLYVREFNIDENLNDKLLSPEMYSFIVSNFRRYRDYRIKGVSDNMEFVNKLEESLIEGTSTLNRLIKELIDYREVLKNL